MGVGYFSSQDFFPEYFMGMQIVENTKGLELKTVAFPFPTKYPNKGQHLDLVVPIVY